MRTKNFHLVVQYILQKGLVENKIVVVRKILKENFLVFFNALGIEINYLSIINKLINYYFTVKIN